MKLYYSPGSCSTSCHITLEEAGIPYEAVAVDWEGAKEPNAAFVSKLNPLGTLPILITDDGRQLDQNLSIHAFIADKAPGKKLLPPPGSFERMEAMNFLSFVAADLHKSIGALFGLSAISPDDLVQGPVRKFMVGRAADCLSYLEAKLEGRDYLMGSQFTVADAYAFVVTSWCRFLELPLTPYKNILGYLARIKSRPAVAKVLKEEGLT